MSKTICPPIPCLLVWIAWVAGLWAQEQALAETQAGLLATADAVQKEVELLRGYPFKHPVVRSVMTKAEPRLVMPRPSSCQ